MENEVGKLPIAEIFTSIQGEGHWTGQLQTFIRTAGCCVGKPVPGRGTYITDLPIWQTACTIYDGREMLCDTDYRKKESLTVAEIAKRIPAGVTHACITGGEPLMHDLRQLCYTLKMLKVQVHIETSGTVPFEKVFKPEDMYQDDIWVTVSPKQNVLRSMIRRADEIKLLVDEHFDAEKLPLGVTDHPLVFVQPVNFNYEINHENVKRCLELQKQFPNWRLSLQLHKILKVK